MNSPHTALVTGAASGIGRALASVLDARCYQVVRVDIDDRGPGSLTGALSAPTVLTADVADPTAMQAIADEVGPVDLLCLNAGALSTFSGPPWEAPAQEWERVYGVNVFGVANGLRAFVPHMIERGVPCRVLVVASLAGVTTWPGGGPYGSSKHAVLALAEQAALELQDTNISVSVVCPALVLTSMSEEGDDPLDLARQALDAVTQGRFAVIPEERHAAVRSRAAALTSGSPPTLPTPHDL